MILGARGRDPRNPLKFPAIPATAERLGLDRLPGKWYTAEPTVNGHRVFMIPIAVGDSYPPFSRRSVQAGGREENYVLRFISIQIFAR